MKFDEKKIFRSLHRKNITEKKFRRSKFDGSLAIHQICQNFPGLCAILVHYTVVCYTVYI